LLHRHPLLVSVKLGSTVKLGPTAPGTLARPLTLAHAVPFARR